MEIYSMPGHLVQCTSTKHSLYPNRIKSAEFHLCVGNIYTIERTAVYRSYTDVYLKEIPGVIFSPGFFMDAIKQPEHFKQGHIDYWLFAGLIANRRTSKYC